MNKLESFIRKKFPKLIVLLKKIPLAVKLKRKIANIRRGLELKYSNKYNAFNYKLKLSNKKISKLIVKIFLALVGYIIFVYLLSIIPNSNISGNNDWVSFYGSLGGGLLTLIGVLLTLDYQNKLHQRQTCPFILIDQVNDMEIDNPIELTFYHTSFNEITKDITETNRIFEINMSKTFLIKVTNIGVSNAHLIHFEDIITKKYGVKVHNDSDTMIKLNVNEYKFFRIKVHTRYDAELLDLHIPMIIHDIHNNKHVQFTTFSLCRANTYPKWTLYIRDAEQPIDYSDFRRAENKLIKKHRWYADRYF